MRTGKVLYMVGHHVRKGQAVCLEGSDCNEPVRFYGEKRASSVRKIVERFNRMESAVIGYSKTSKNVQNYSKEQYENVEHSNGR